MQIKIKKKYAWTLIIATIVLFLIPVIGIIIEPLIERALFNKFGNCWIGCAVVYFCILLWVLIAGEKTR